MNLFPRDPAARRALALGAALAAAALAATAVFDLPALTGAVLPGVWVVLQAGGRRARPACAGTPPARA
ncbi:hypothetical protein [Lysobacter humi (ex Lee et al. 2017)]